MTTDTITRAADLLPTLYAAMDEHRFDDLAALFTADVTATTPGGAMTGRDQLVAQARRNHQGVRHLQHLIAGVVEAPTPDGAELRANVVAVFGDDDGHPTYEVGDLWRGDAVVDGDGHWRIASFTTTPVWSRGVRPVLPAG